MKRPMCFVALGFMGMLALLLPLLGFIPKDYNVLPMLKDSDRVCVIGTVESICTKGDNQVYTISSASFFSDKHSPQTQPASLSKFNPSSSEQSFGLMLYVPSDGVPGEPVSPGCQIMCEGRFYHYELPDIEGAFNLREYYYIHGLHGKIIGGTILAVSQAKSSTKVFLYNVRDRISELYKKFAGKEQGAILSAMLLGDKSQVDSELKRTYQNAGISHVLSLSGLHIASIAFAFLKLLRRLPIHRFTEPVIAALITILLFLYCIMTGMAVSTIRAFIMFVLGLLAALLNKTYDLLSAAAFSSMVALAANPLYLYDAGFRLSFAAVISIAMIWPIIQNMLPRSLYRTPEGRFRNDFPHRCLRFIVEGLTLSISIMLGTLPLTLWHFYQLPLIGILLNLIVVPLMSLVIYSGMVLGALGCLFPDATGLLRVIAMLPRVILTLYERLCEEAVSIPGSVIIVGRPALWKVVLYYVLLGVFIYVLRNDSRRLITLAAFFVLVALLCCRMPERLIIRNLSVGQGDCSIISMQNHTFLVDCGSTDRLSVGQYCLIPCLKYIGIGRLDAVFVTHFDADHVNGILELMQDPIYKGRIEKIVIACLGMTESEHYVNLTELANIQHIPVYLMQAGDEINIGTLNLLCLSPSSKQTYADINDASLVLRLIDSSSGFCGLFTGDISSATESTILNRLSQVDYLKVAHHGSRYSTDCDFAKRVRPKLAIISVGANNRYGHPHEETLERLRNIGAAIYRTDECGEVIVSIERANKMNVRYVNR